MQEKMLSKIATITIVIGLIFLFLYSQTIDLDRIENLDTVKISEPIKIEGRIEKVVTTDKAIFLTLSGYKVDTFEVILFPKEEVILTTGDNVEITGKVEEYLGKKEIIADSISLLK